MKFRFCGDADCPDWVLAEMNSISRLSSVKVKLLAQVVAQGIITPPIDMEKAEKLFADSKLDGEFDLKACIACISFVITSAARFSCDHGALHSELQQLGLPREHSTSIKRVADEYEADLSKKLRKTSLKVNPLQEATAKMDLPRNCVSLNLVIGGESKTVTMTPFTVDVLIENIKQARAVMQELSS